MSSSTLLVKDLSSANRKALGLSSHHPGAVIFDDLESWECRGEVASELPPDLKLQVEEEVNCLLVRKTGIILGVESECKL